MTDFIPRQYYNRLSLQKGKGSYPIQFLLFACCGIQQVSMVYCKSVHSFAVQCHSDRFLTIPPLSHQTEFRDHTAKDVALDINR